MMRLVFSGLSTSHEFRTCEYWSDDLEVGIDVLARLVHDGWQLTGVYLIEEGKRIDLPIDAFDSTSMRHGIHELQLEWERLLSDTSQ